MYLYLIYVVAVIGFNQTVYTFEEGDGTVEVCAAFLDPSRIAPNVVIELMGTTSPSKYPTCCGNVYSLSKPHTSVTAAHMFACWFVCLDQPLTISIKGMHSIISL